jgi:hypothetical protein
MTRSGKSVTHEYLKDELPFENAMIICTEATVSLSPA